MPRTQRRQQRRRMRGGGIEEPMKKKKLTPPVIKTVKVNNVKNIPEETHNSIIEKVKEMSKKGYQPTPNALQGSLKEFRTVQTPDTTINQQGDFFKLLMDRKTNASPARTIRAPVTSYIGSPYILPRPGLPNDLPEKWGYRNSITVLSDHEPPYGARLAGAQPVQW